MKKNNRKWIPDILYAEDEETNNLTNGLPFIELKDEKSMPDRLFILSAKTVIDNNEELQEFDLHQYFSLDYLKECLDKNIIEQIIRLYKQED